MTLTDQEREREIGQAAVRAAEEFKEHLTGELYLIAADPDKQRTPIESPLEEAFLVWWSALKQPWLLAHAMFFDLELEPQHEVNCHGINYRLDFRVRAEQYPELKVAVELDGHEFHERTAYQVAWRDRRDRLLQRDGWLVLHFSGSEFHRDKYRCVYEAYDLAERECFRLWRMGGVEEGDDEHRGDVAGVGAVKGE